MNGFILLHRRLLDKPIWFNSTPEQRTILITLLLMATHKEIKWDWNGKTFDLQPGQFVTSLAKIVVMCGKGISEQNVRTALARFKKLEFLTDEPTHAGRLITIVNWRVYQDAGYADNRQTNRQLTDDQQTPNRPLNNNIKTKQEISNIYACARACETAPAESVDHTAGAQREEQSSSVGKGEYTQEFLEFWAEYPRKRDKVRAYRVWRARRKEKVPAGTMIRAARNYAEKTRGRDEEKIKHASTFLGPDRPYEDYAQEGSGDGNQGENGGIPAEDGPNWDKYFA